MYMDMATHFTKRRLTRTISAEAPDSTAVEDTAVVVGAAAVPAHVLARVLAPAAVEQGAVRRLAVRSAISCAWLLLQCRKL